MPPSLVGGSVAPSITNTVATGHIITDHLLREVPAVLCVGQREVVTIMLFPKHLLDLFSDQGVISGGPLVWDIQKAQVIAMKYASIPISTSWSESEAQSKSFRVRNPPSTTSITSGFAPMFTSQFQDSGIVNTMSYWLTMRSSIRSHIANPLLVYHQRLVAHCTY